MLSLTAEEVLKVVPEGAKPHQAQPYKEVEKEIVYDRKSEVKSASLVSARAATVPHSSRTSN